MKHITIYETVRKPISVALMLIYLVCIACSFAFLNAKMTGFYLLYVFSRFAFFLSAFLSVIAYLSGITSLRSNTDEVISAKKYPGFYQNNTFLFLFGYTLFLLASLLVFLVIASVSNDGTDYFFGYFSKSFACNLLLPMMISLGVAYLASRAGGRIISAAFLMLFLLLTSPVFTNLAWRNQPTYPIDKIFSVLIHPFRIFYENGIWTPNSQLGLQTDSSRLSLLLFWVLFLAGAIHFSLLRKHAKKRVYSIALVIVSLCCLVYSYFPSGAYRIDENSWDGSLQDYYSYYNQPIGVSYDTTDYTFTDYELDLTFGRFMTVDAKLQLHSDIPRSQFDFTLYHGYQIRSLTVDDTTVSWSKEEDTVTLITEEPITDCTLHLSYLGSHNIFFSYSEGALLPGWFPWYPMAGRNQVFLNFETYPSGYNTFNRIDPTHISLRIDSNFTMVSNLGTMEGNCIEGTSDSITLLGGEILPLSQGQVKDCLPLDLTQNELEWSKNVSQQWEATCDALTLYGLTPPAENDCNILVASKELTRFYLGTNGVAFFDDYILTCEGQLSIADVSKEMILKYNSTSYLASIVCSWGGLYSTPQETLTMWLERLQYGLHDDPLETCLLETLEAADACGRGTEAVQEIAQFLCEEGATGNEQAFLEGLCDRYDSY